jgi:NADP-reducing hydrogenase subunit HndB
MIKITSFDQLKKISAEEKLKLATLSDPNHPEKILQVKVTMATCGIASGSRQILDFMQDELSKRNIPALVTKTGCMGFCYAEPTIEVTVPGKEVVVFGYVDQKKADEIIEKYIRKGETVEGIIPRLFETIDSI